MLTISNDALETARKVLHRIIERKRELIERQLVTETVFQYASGMVAGAQAVVSALESMMLNGSQTT